MDRVTKFLTHEGRVNIICAKTTDMVEEIRKIHDLTPTTTAAMGRIATISGMMGLIDLKNDDDRITIQIDGRGPVGTIISVIRRENDCSKVKLCIDNPHVELPLKANGHLDVGGAIGNQGFINIINKNVAMDSNYTGLVPLETGEVAEDFTAYYAKSKQVPTVIALGVLVDKDGVKSAGGYMIQLMPDATEEDITKIEEALKVAPSISKMIDDEMSLEDIARTVTGDTEIMVLAKDPEMKYECDCSKEQFEKGLISLGKDELEKIIEEDGKCNVECHFCNKHYEFTKEELENLLKQI